MMVVEGDWNPCEKFSRLVMPELQRGGIYHMEYAGPAPRQTLGQERASAGGWRDHG